MDSKLVAYNSKALRAVFVIVNVVLFVTVAFCVRPMLEHPIILGALLLLFLSFTIITLRILLDRSPIAFECDYQELVIYRNDKRTVIPLSEIKWIAINEMDNLCSFDATLHCVDKKVFMHKLIKNGHEVYEKFLEIMRSRGIRIDIRELSIGGD